MYDVLIISTVWKKENDHLMPVYQALIWESFFRKHEAQVELNRIKQQYSVYAFIVER